MWCEKTAQLFRVQKQFYGHHSRERYCSTGVPSIASRFLASCFLLLITAYYSFYHPAPSIYIHNVFFPSSTLVYIYHTWAVDNELKNIINTQIYLVFTAFLFYCWFFTPVYRTATGHRTNKQQRLAHAVTRCFHAHGVPCRQSFRTNEQWG